MFCGSGRLQQKQAGGTHHRPVLHMVAVLTHQGKDGGPPEQPSAAADPGRRPAAPQGS